ncbi:MBL fold metallo-hydrolase [Amnibacterium setariae]|uniref:MBL fold metallo-hydrolase n=1 Tax=Amnibacterium setariae TaxID=2306585 RepID=A0A3A1U6P1_9MICO|nr:MBL fold metallo-hydrolase [Amnibacterium setariae]RIX28594.1 MBL fold metallo-hydrolase [Amnibacterium setariae]
MEQVTRDVFMVRGTAVNQVLLREGRDLTLIDAGYPRDAARIVAAIERIGHRLDDVRAVLVTHAHVDHVGGLPALLARRSVPVLAHPREVPNARGDVHEQAAPRDVVLRSLSPRGIGWLASIVRAGGSAHVRVPTVVPFPRSGALDVPGRPTPVLSAGHTSGHTAYLLAAEGMLATGDALVTGHPLLPWRGPQLLPELFANDPSGALDALTELAGQPADIVLPGHGAIWRGDLREAADLARAAAPRSTARAD